MSERHYERQRSNLEKMAGLLHRKSGSQRRKGWDAVRIKDFRERTILAGFVYKS